MFLKEAHVVHVCFAPRIAEMVSKLKLWRETPNGNALYRAGGVVSLRGIDAPSPVGKFLPTVTGVVEHQRMEVDFSSVSIFEHHASRKAGVSAGVMAEGQVSQRGNGNGQPRPLDREV